MSKSQSKKCSRERGVVFSERTSANRIINGGCASFYRAVMSEDDLVFFVSFYPKTLFLSVPFRTREKDFLVNARHRHRVRFMTMLLEERDERINDDIDDFDEY